MESAGGREATDGEGFRVSEGGGFRVREGGFSLEAVFFNVRVRGKLGKGLSDQIKLPPFILANKS